MSELRLDDLQYKGLRIYQHSGLPSFTQDSVLLADFAKLRADDNAVDLGAGTGALTLLCHARTGAQFTCVEREPALAALLRESLTLNALPFPVHTMDWTDAPAALGHGKYTAALLNPPYFAGPASPQQERAAARSDAGTGTGAGLSSTLAEGIQSAFLLLKNGGGLYMCYPARQLDDAMVALRQARFYPRLLQLVAGNEGAAPYLALLYARKATGKESPGMRLLPQLTIRDANGQYTAQALRIYHMEGET